MPLHLKMKLPERGLRAPGSLLHSRVEPHGSARADVPSFRSIYQTYFDFVWSTARRLGVDAESMDDVVQEVFIVIHARLDTLERPEALRSWIYGVVRRTVSTYRRARQTRPSANAGSDFTHEMAFGGPTPLEQAETNAAWQLLNALLSELDEPKREIFSLVELDELSVREAAEALEIPVNTASSRLRIARQAFDAALARHEARTRGR